MQRILIIEDDQPLLKVYTDVLTQEGYDVVTAQTAPEALRKITEDHISLILLDIMLPGGMNGFDFLQRVRQDESLHAVPIIVLTNLDSEKQTALDFGAADYYFKPHMDVKMLVEKIRTHLPPAS